ncbi:Olfactory receptor-like protein OLF4 [Pteropus alecto]|uniref:Olfactory receptor-like protein OLF4 n=1 Tax=Pteropus alecto TaxID=9402 RepID=L5K9T3_PTEAL|nr:Olfactory receptor-like protein OLF4 [Pteropus alecto]
MEPGNDTRISEFLFLGLSEEPKLQPLIFGLFLSMYLITVLGNVLIILAVSSDSHLYTPMYFFLSNLSLVDICFTSTTIPKMLVNIQTQSKVITYEGCITQLYFFLFFGAFDDFLLTLMAYDRFVAICHPLHYTVIMNPQLCGLLLLVCWIMSVLYSLLQSLMVLRLSFCTDLEIPHFFCELNQMIKLACSDAFLNNMVMYSGVGLMGVGPLIGLGVYLSSAATHSSQSSAVASVMYTVVTPMLNPFIYSLRNKDIQVSLKKFFGMAGIKITE